MKIEVIGLGYVGLPLWIQFARSCVSVLGLDADPKKVELLNNGQSYIKHIQSAEIAKLVAADRPVAPCFSHQKETAQKAVATAAVQFCFTPLVGRTETAKCLSGTN
jgi:UDP-N-acetyl-D-mannosaminuronate dehydrogenase